MIPNLCLFPHNFMQLSFLSHPSFPFFFSHPEDDIIYSMKKFIFVLTRISIIYNLTFFPVSCNVSMCQICRFLKIHFLLTRFPGSITSQESNQSIVTGRKDTRSTFEWYEHQCLWRTKCHYAQYWTDTSFHQTWFEKYDSNNSWRPVQSSS